MSKKNRHKNTPTSTAAVAAASGIDLQNEYRIIHHDLIRVAILNALFLVAVLALYYTNHTSRYLERWFSQIVK